MTTEKTDPLRPRVGDVIAAKYRLVRRIGEGGMGEVYEAQHLQLNERVALKTLLGSLEQSDEFRVRFLREAQATAKLRNEHVVRVYDVGELPGGAPYIVMEYLEGHDLGSYRRGQTGRPVPEIVDFILQACEALAEAHVKGIVHRDLKPSNLFLTMRSDGTPCVKVLDFGISKVAEIDDGLTGTNASLGTLRYMSPEQLQSSRDVDARTDIWSLGVVIFELLTHKLPFVADGGSLAIAIVSTPPRSLTELRGDVPPGLVETTMRCLEKDRARRFESISDLAIALAPFGTDDARRSCERVIRIAGLPSRPSIPVPQATLVNPAPPNTAAGWSSGRRTETRYGIALVAGLGGLILMGMLALAVRAHFDRADPVRPAASSSQPVVTSTPETVDASPSASASQTPAITPTTSTTPAPSAPSAAPSSHPSRPPPRPKPTATVADDRHG